ncbi:SEC-C metal-binding domain-containing protein [Bradymonas sediminis]|uniref:Uncharacterized protein n=1 Tax=Bradymonas sediminis TaxID=1548548 RepID=A0A2Z4FK62_9DELT|nr:SEC-C metal-binding domain-containing protein [Bradymonas sediminis]AWV89064.1 hypothetical protein DN745_06835 [Bradymonas sediminis]TDP64473.1 SEC-C motif-containing protein [Bradymonas sediminis]
MTNTEIFSTQTIRQRIDVLLNQGEALTASARADIVALGTAATPELIRILEDRKLWDDQAPGEGFAPIYAAEILGEIGDPDALDALYVAFRKVDRDAILDDALTDAIRAYGQAAIPAGLRALESWDDPFLADLAFLFSELNTSPANQVEGAEQLGLHDPELHRKALQVLLKFFIKYPVPGAELLANFGDPVAVDALSVAMDRYIASAKDDPKYRRPIFALADAIKQLGGALRGEQKGAIMRLKANRSASEVALDKLHAKDSADDSQTVKKDRHLGRNEPCWCGSGRKYKRCHLNDDLAESPDEA